MSEDLKIPVSEIKEGDYLVNSDGRLGWRALEDADVSRATNEIWCRVQYPDGGISDRIWDNDRIIEVRR